MRALRAARTAFAVLALVRLARGRRRRAPLSAAALERGGVPKPAGTVSVVVPARNEAERIGPCLAGLRADPDVGETIVVDDRSEDDTAAIARAGGARVVEGAPPPTGWIGKQWAQQQGLEAAVGEWVVSLDADACPRPGLIRAVIAELRDADLVTVAPRFVCDSWGERLLHPSMLATLAYRFGPLGAEGGAPSPQRTTGNGQCFAASRERLLASGVLARVSDHITDDIAMLRTLAGDGWRIRFVDGADLLAVKMHASVGELWTEWARTLAMADVTSRRWQLLDLGVVWLAMAAPIGRTALGRASRLDALLLLVRCSLLVPLARFYARRGPAFWLSPLADVATAVRLTLSTVRPSRTWRGRTYPGAGQRRAGIGQAIVAGYRRLPQAQDDLAWSDAASAAMVAEEPW